MKIKERAEWNSIIKKLKEKKKKKDCKTIVKKKLK